MTAKGRSLDETTRSSSTAQPPTYAATQPRPPPDRLRPPLEQGGWPAGHLALAHRPALLSDAIKACQGCSIVYSKFEEYT